MSVLGKRLILVVGKGGVGRSTVSACIARLNARNGHKTLLFESNPNERFGRLFGVEKPIGEHAVSIEPNLSALNTNAHAALEEYGLMVLRFKRVYRLVFENRITRYFLRAIPGLDDYSILGKAWFHTEQQVVGRPQWDTVVFDMPASGHSLSMLRLPQAILDVVPDGPLTRDARKIRELLGNTAQTAIVMTTLPEEMPGNEAIELKNSLEQNLGRPVDQLVVNQMHPDFIPRNSLVDQAMQAIAVAPSRSATMTALHSSATLASARRRLNELHLSRLEQEFDCASAVLPKLFGGALGPNELSDLAENLARQINPPDPMR